MIRTQVQLDDEQVAALRKLAAERNVSMASLVRGAVAQMLGRGDDREERIRRALAAIGRFRSGKTDIGEEHDRYLVEDFLD